MRFPKLSFIPFALACLIFPLVAPAMSEQAATTQSASPQQAPSVEDATLAADYLALIDRAEACPRGTCADAAAIRRDFDALEQRRAALTTKDAAIDLLASSLAGKLDGWEEQS